MDRYRQKKIIDKVQALIASHSQHPDKDISLTGEFTGAALCECDAIISGFGASGILLTVEPPYRSASFLPDGGVDLLQQCHLWSANTINSALLSASPVTSSFYVLCQKQFGRAWQNWLLYGELGVLGKAASCFSLSEKMR
ncbi:hypothetical protein [Endozoicomonas sp.]|uniref:hypothetical protein n=1 Tax=Endozoicomonas sp. TaxID=1892382 RepID=UPI003AF7A5A8